MIGAIAQKVANSTRISCCIFARSRAGGLGSAGIGMPGESAVRYEDVERYLRALNLLRHELSSSHPAVELEMRSHLVTATNPVSGKLAVERALQIVGRDQEVRRLFAEVLSRVDPELPIPMLPAPEPPPPYGPGTYPTTVGAPPLAGDVTPTPALELICPNDPSHPRARIGVFNRLMPPRCPYCKVRLVDRRSRS